MMSSPIALVGLYTFGIEVRDAKKHEEKEVKNMAKIFNPPEGYDPPEIKPIYDRKDIDQYHKDCLAYENRLKKFIKDTYGSVCPEAGEEIRFQVGDGYARYIVARLKPVELIHINTGDAWHFQYVHLLKAKDVREEIKKIKDFCKLFNKVKSKTTTLKMP